MLTPSLDVPRVAIKLNAGNGLQTGETCEIVREFSDETGPRYGETGVRTFTGAPFSVLDTHGVLDCSSWPAGAYELKETYRNGLGQTAESTLNFTINNRPAPDFSLSVSGHQNATDTPCMVRMLLEDGCKIVRLLSANAVVKDIHRHHRPIILDLRADNRNIPPATQVLPRQIQFSACGPADRLEALACFPGINNGLQALLANLVL